MQARKLQIEALFIGTAAMELLMTTSLPALAVAALVLLCGRTQAQDASELSFKLDATTDF